MATFVSEYTVMDDVSVTTLSQPLITLVLVADKFINSSMFDSIFKFVKFYLYLIDSSVCH